jgi:hypothetical protein
MRKYRLHFMGLLLLIIASVSYLWANQVDQIEVMSITMEELDWYNADNACSQIGGGWALPSISQLVGLFYFNSNASWNRSTDYWSNTRISDRGFGLNTKLGILSFDVLRDQDHFICVRDKHLLAHS